MQNPYVIRRFVSPSALKITTRFHEDPFYLPGQDGFGPIGIYLRLSPHQLERAMGLFAAHAAVPERLSELNGPVSRGSLESQASNPQCSCHQMKGSPSSWQGHIGFE